jgi:hypothetical protein
MLYLLLWPLALLGGIMNSPIAIVSKLGGTLAARGEVRYINSILIDIRSLRLQPTL